MLRRDVYAANQIEKILKPLDADERKSAMRMLPFCPECGQDDPDAKCQCSNDE